MVNLDDQIWTYGSLLLEKLNFSSDYKVEFYNGGWKFNLFIKIMEILDYKLSPYKYIDDYGLILYDRRGGN